MKKDYRPWALMGLVLASTLFFWFLFSFGIVEKLGFGKTSLLTVVANHDGPNYLAIAKCWYGKDCIRSGFSLPLPLEYYAAHLPGYPLLVSIFDLVAGGPWAMLLATLSGSMAAVWAFYKLSLSVLKNKDRAFWLVIVFLFLPARYFVLRMIGAPETWFVAAVLWSVYFFRKKNYLVSGLWAVLAQSLKSPGILLLASMVVVWMMENRGKIKERVGELWPYFLVPLSLGLIFLVYKIQLNDFWAYFHSGDNFHLNPLPYLVFVSTKSWLGTIWLEDVIYIFLLGMIGLVYLKNKFWEQDKILVVFPLIYFLATLLVAHRDVSRYVVPVYPFVLLALEKFLAKKEFKIIFLLLLPAIVLYGVNFVFGNTAPIADWAPYL
jgi:Gpi18-like mannosyltransferase